METVERDVLTAIYNTRERLGRITEHAMAKGDPWLEQQGYKGSIYLRKTLEAIHALPGGQIVPDRTQSGSVIYKTLKLAHDSINEFAENTSAVGREGIGAINDLRLAMSLMEVGRHGVGDRTIERTHHVPFLFVEDGKMAVYEWHSADPLPHYSGVARCMDDTKTNKFIYTAIENGERTINFLLADTLAEADQEAAELPEKLARLQKQEDARLAGKSKVGSSPGRQDQGEALKASEARLIKAGHWYPCGKSMGSTDWMYVISVEDGVVKGYNESPSFWSWHTRPTKIPLRNFEAMLPNSIRNAITESEATISNLKGFGWTDDDLHSLRNEIHVLTEMAGGNVISSQYLDDRMYFDIWVEPSADVSGDPWNFLDSLTGGNCTTQRTASNGAEQYEVRVLIETALEMEKNAALNFVSVNLECPQGAEIYLSPDAKRLLDQYPVETESVRPSMGM